MARRAWTIANGVMLLAFLFSVIVQVNDPDPLPWMTIYGAAAFLCGLAMARRVHWWSAAVVAVVAIIWAATLVPGVLGKVPFTEMFGAFEMKNEGVEESREMYGLVLIAVWMGVVALRTAGTGNGERGSGKIQQRE